MTLRNLKRIIENKCGLSFSDALNVSLFFLTGIGFLVAGGGVYLAYVTLTEARSSGKSQEIQATAAQNALDVSTQNLIAVNRQLEIQSGVLNAGLLAQQSAQTALETSKASLLRVNAQLQDQYQVLSGTLNAAKQENALLQTSEATALQISSALNKIKNQPSTFVLLATRLRCVRTADVDVQLEADPYAKINRDKVSVQDSGWMIDEELDNRYGIKIARHDYSLDLFSDEKYMCNVSVKNIGERAAGEYSVSMFYVPKNVTEWTETGEVIHWPQYPLQFTYIHSGGQDTWQGIGRRESPITLIEGRSLAPSIQDVGTEVAFYLKLAGPVGKSAEALGSVGTMTFLLKNKDGDEGTVDIDVSDLEKLAK